MTLPLALLLQRGDDDWSSYLLFLLFVVAPLVARGFKWLGTKLRGGTPEGQSEDPGERLRRRREERRRAEAEGEDLWRRLARGEVVEAPPPVQGQGRPAAQPQPMPEFSFERDLATEREEVEQPVERELSLEREEEPRPLSVLGEVSEPGEAAETSLEGQAEPAPLAAITRPADAGRRRARRRAFSLGDTQRALVIAEVFGPPLSDRPPRQ